MRWRTGFGWKCINGSKVRQSMHINTYAQLFDDRKRKVKNMIVSIWLGVIWSIWRWRNKIIFKNGAMSIEKLVDELRSRVWNWLIVKCWVLHEQSGSLILE